VANMPMQELLNLTVVSDGQVWHRLTEAVALELVLSRVHRPGLWLPRSSMADRLLFDQEFQEESLKVAQDAVVRTLDGKAYQHGKVCCCGAAFNRLELIEVTMTHQYPSHGVMSFEHTRVARPRPDR
jgi:hypothetical protein